VNAFRAWNEVAGGKTSLSCRARLARDRTPNDEQKRALADWPEAANRFAAVMLHLRSRYVSKAAILTDLALHACRSKIEVSLEFQGLGSLGAASWRRFFPLRI